MPEDVGARRLPIPDAAAQADASGHAHGDARGRLDDEEVGAGKKPDGLRRARSGGARIGRARIRTAEADVAGAAERLRPGRDERYAKRAAAAADEAACAEPNPS